MEPTINPQPVQVKKKPKILLIVLAVILGLILAILAAFCITMTIDCDRIYKAGVSHYESGNYLTATEMFGSLVEAHPYQLMPGIRDSDQMMRKSLAKASIDAWDAVENGSLGMISLVQGISKEWNGDLDLLMDIFYDAGTDCVAEEKYDAALILLNIVNARRDISQYVQQCHYLSAEQYQSQGELLFAQREFESAGTYSDAAERALEAGYLYGTQRLDEGLYGAAHDALEPLGDYKDSADLVQYCLAMSKAQENLMTAEKYLADLPDDLRNVAQLKAQIELFRPFAGMYECTDYKGDLYENGVGQNKNVYKQYPFLDVVPRYIQLDKSSTELTLRVVLEGCNEKKAGRKVLGVITDLSLFEKSSFDLKLVTRETDGTPERWLNLSFSEGKFTMEDVYDYHKATYDEIRNYTFTRIN